MKKRILIGLLAFLTACSGVVSYACTAFPVHAAKGSTESGIVDFGQGTASITIHGNQGQSLIGKKFHIYRLFDAENSVSGESIQYTINANYQTAMKNMVGKALEKNPSDVTEYEIIDYVQSLNSNVVEGVDVEQTLEGNYSQFRYFVENLRNEMVKLGNPADIVTVTSVNTDNSIRVMGLPYGYYIVDEISDNAGTHSASSLCMVSTANPDTTMNIKSDYPSVEKKIQEDDNKETIGNDGWNDIGDYEIGQIVPYKFESSVPNMNGYDTYYYAWHDVMDQALTFSQESVRVVISDGTKDYELKQTEFTVSEKTDGDTFKVEITDLKAIIDREYDKIDELGHNTYGQKVTLTYQAVLNDLAANDTGRPGFENDVRLEFSNDPDGSGAGKTGYTPWDTVVCFTYKLNVLKVNDQELPLESAKFRLYYDEKCTQEVYVKDAANGYHVMNRDTAGDQVPDSAVEMSSKEDGTFVIYGLDQETYYLKETEAPDGYRVIEDPIVLKIEPTFTSERNSYVKGDGATEKTLKNLSYSVYVKRFFGGLFHENTESLETDITEGAGNLTVINQVGAKLPVTGSHGMLVLLFMGCGIILLSRLIPEGKKRNGR